MTVPEPTEAMVGAAAKIGVEDEWDAGPEQWRQDSRDLARDMFRAAVAAAPPEWLLRAALGEDEIEALLRAAERTDPLVRSSSLLHSAKAKLFRALRGGEEK